MRHKAQVILMLAVAAFALTGITALRMVPQPGVFTTNIDPIYLDPGYIDVDPALIGPTSVEVDVTTALTGIAWFQGFRQHCNHVEIDTQMRWQPAPGSVEGDMYKAACYALAGRIDQARDVIESLPDEMEYQAAGVVFNTGHPAADAGDELAAGPLMELVVEFWPNHYMALYHAGASSYERGDYAAAVDYLERFLVEYSQPDGWTNEAKRMLAAMELEGR